MPLATSLESHEEKSRYLKDLFDRTYIKDVLERHEIKNDTEVLDILLDVLASGIGSLTNPSKMANAFKSERKIVVVRDYLKPWQDENGITYVGIEQFLLNEDLLK